MPEPTTVGVVSDEPSQPPAPADLAALALRAADAKGVERGALTRRDAAVVAAVRAGARLDEIAQAANVTKAAASAIARKTLPPRTRRGGPYQRRRGVEAALTVVSEASLTAAAATRERLHAVGERDAAILLATERGVAARAIGEAVGMDTKVLHNLIRRRRFEAASKCNGTLASPVAIEARATP